MLTCLVSFLQYITTTDASGKKIIKKVVKKVIKKKKKSTAGGADDDSSSEEEVYIDESGQEVQRPSMAKKKLAARTFDEDESYSSENLEKQYEAFMNYDAGLSWDEPAAVPGGAGGGPPPPPPMMGGGPPPPPPMGGGPPPPPPMGAKAKPKMKLRKLNWKKIPKNQLETVCLPKMSDIYIWLWLTYPSFGIDYLSSPAIARHQA